MTSRERSSPGKHESVVDLISVEIEHKLSLVNEALAKGQQPSAEDVDAIERLSKLKALLPPADDRWRQRLDLLLLCVAAIILLVSVLVRLPSTSVDLDVRATGVNLTLAGQRSDLLVPGELGEIVALKQVRVSRADQIFPPESGSGGNLELRQAVSPKTTAPRKDNADLAVRLQEISIPSDVPFKIALTVSYSADSRGLAIDASGAKPITVQLGEVIEVEAVTSAAHRRYAILPVRAIGNNLNVELYPIDKDQPLTVFRDVQVSEINFDGSGHSSILSGLAVIKSATEAGVKIQPSDRLQIRSREPMLVRELTFAKGELKARVSSDTASTILLGDKNPKNLMPTIFDWVRFRWPTQLYGAISALAVLWLALRRWWSSGNEA